MYSQNLADLKFVFCLENDIGSAFRLPCALGSTHPPKNEYQDIPGGKDGQCVRMTTLPPSCAECLEILEP